MRHYFSFGSFYFWCLVVFLYCPILLLLIFSFNDSTALRFPLDGFTWRWYTQLFTSPPLLTATWNSLWLGLWSSALATALGAMAALAIVRFNFYGKGVLLAVAGMPLVIPAVVIGVALLILYRQFLGLDLNLWTAGLGHVVVHLPVVMLIVAARLAGMPPELEEAAMDLGATYWRAQLYIILPLCAPALAAAFLTAFTTSFDEYAMTTFLVGQEITLPIYIYSLLRFPRNLPVITALGTLIVVGSLLLIVVAERLRRSGE